MPSALETSEANRLEMSKLIRTAEMPQPLPTIELGKSLGKIAEPKAEPKPVEAKVEAQAGKEVVAPAKVEEAKPPVEVVKADDAEAKRQQEYIHRIHMERVEAERQLAAAQERLAIYEKKVDADLTPEQRAELAAEEKVTLLARKEAEKMLTERDKKALENQALAAGTTPENFEKWKVSVNAMQSLKSDFERFPLMKEEPFRKFIADPATLEKILNPILASSQGRRNDLEVLGDPMTWELVYMKAQAMQGQVKPATPAPTRKQVALAAAVQPSASVSVGPVASANLDDEPEWKEIVEAHKQGLNF